MVPLSASAVRDAKGWREGEGRGGREWRRFTLIAREALRASLDYPSRASPCLHTRFLYTQRYAGSALFTRYTEIQGGVPVCVSNVHLIITKTVIQARKLGRGAARSQWKKPRVPREFLSFTCYACSIARFPNYSIVFEWLANGPNPSIARFR